VADRSGGTRTTVARHIVDGQCLAAFEVYGLVGDGEYSRTVIMKALLHESVLGR